MAIRLPSTIIAEYRGAQPGGEFTNRETGEQVEYGRKLKLEIEDPQSGDVTLLPLREGDFDRAEPPFDASKLQKGDVLALEIVAVIGTGDERSYLQLRSARYAADVPTLKPVEKSAA